MRAAAALCLLLSIVADVAADARCDLPSAPAGALSAAGAMTPSNDEDLCAAACIPDCYCCSRTLAANRPVLPAGAGPLARATVAGVPAAATGVRPVPYHPPLTVV